MKTPWRILLCLMIGVAGWVLTSSQGLAAESNVRHFVAFKFKDGVTPAEIAEVTTALVALKGQVDGIISVESGTNQSQEKLNEGFTNGYLFTFRSAADRDAYLVHPAHLAFLKLAQPKIEKAFVFDYAPGSGV